MQEFQKTVVMEFTDRMKLKQAIIVRTDLGIGKGKIVGQVTYATVEAAESIRRFCPDSTGKYDYAYV